MKPAPLECNRRATSLSALRPVSSYPFGSSNAKRDERGAVMWRWLVEDFVEHRDSRKRDWFWVLAISAVVLVLAIGCREFNTGH
jgi:hypothetical protein